MTNREFEIIVWGASGFTGRLVCAYLAKRYGQQLNWAMAGRNRDKLVTVRDALGADAAEVPLVIADSHDRDSLDELAGRTRVVLTTVGPYSLYGSELVGACAAQGTGYCDLSGEVPWMRRMLEQHAAAAEACGARIVHCCGFDSIPSDMGVFKMNEVARERTGEPCQAIRYRLKAAKGGPSGGTVASMLNIVSEARKDKETARILKDPYALCPPDHRGGPRQPYVSTAAYDSDLKAWTGPFVMGLVNTRVVHKSNALSSYAYGQDFRYDEAVVTGAGLGGRLKAMSIAAGLASFAVGASFAPTRALMQKLFLPDPGEGPSPEQQAAGFFNIVLIGDLADGSQLRMKVTGDRDPGYGSTSKMISEAALCLARDVPEETTGGGIWTPATAMGEALLARLEENAGLTFELLED